MIKSRPYMNFVFDFLLHLYVIGISKPGLAWIGRTFVLNSVQPQAVLYSIEYTHMSYEQCIANGLYAELCGEGSLFLIWSSVKEGSEETERVIRIHAFHLESIA